MTRRLILIWVALLIAVSMSFESAAHAQVAPPPRPTRYPRPGIPRPERTPRPGPTARPDRPTRPPRDASPTPTSVDVSPGATTTPTATPTPSTTPGSGTLPSCENACAYNLSQMRLTWYDANSGGLNLSFFVQGGDCPVLTPQAGELGSIQMSHWLTERRQDTGRLHTTTFTLGANGSGATSNGGVASIAPYGTAQQVVYRTIVPPIAGPNDGADFPVVFDLCVTIGDQAIKGRMVCQEKNRGLLCHQG